MIVTAALALSTLVAFAPPPLREDDLTPQQLNIIRATVVIKGGPNRGSGTIIASVPGDTLILTAWHVVAGQDQPIVALHRYNLGLERTSRAPGRWPQEHPARVVASDKDCDLAILRVSGLSKPLPHIATLEQNGYGPLRGQVVASVGVTGGVDLSYWESAVVGRAAIDLNRGGGRRLFLITVKPPEPGRSGGGLYREDGALVGVTVGQIRTPAAKGEVWGVFANTRDVSELLASRDLDAVVARSIRESANRSRAKDSPTSRAAAPPRARVTPRQVGANPL